MSLIQFAEMGLVPDWLIRVGIRRLLEKRRRAIAVTSDEQRRASLQEFTRQLRTAPLAVDTDAANDQHYEVPAEFFSHVLGPRLKYSCCLFPNDECTLAEAEEAMLARTCQRAELHDGQRILELGCGWGSLTLWIAQQFPKCHITAVSNSVSQREFIERRAAAAGLSNVRIITADMREFALDEQFDRVVSVEMFEHMRNLELLLQRVSGWLREDGKALVHVFCHKNTPYLFETKGNDNWMGRHFFTGGMMPSEHLFQEFDENLAVEQQYRVDGLHYWKTSEAWLQNLDRNHDAILKRFRQDTSAARAKRTLQRWRIFFMACAELFRYGGGNEWFVGHYRFVKSAARTANELPTMASHAK